MLGGSGFRGGFREDSLLRLRLVSQRGLIRPEWRKRVTPYELKPQRMELSIPTCVLPKYLTLPVAYAKEESLNG